jgi:hypothetical protein
MIITIEKNIMAYRMDMSIINDLYYCGRGDVDSYINQWCADVYRKIEACNRLMMRFENRLDKLNNVVGA